MEELELNQEVIEYLDSLDEETREIFDQYISLMDEEFDWVPSSANDAGLWFIDSNTFWSNEINIGADGSYAIYYLDKFENDADTKERLREIFSSWSSELSGDGEPHPR